MFCPELIVRQLRAGGNDGSRRQCDPYWSYIDMPVRFGDFVLDVLTRQLLNGSVVVHLSPKAFQLLAVLVEQRPKAISKNELQEQLWPSTFVTDTSLPNLIAEVRAALNEDSRKPQFVRTVYGFGYSFIADATEQSTAARTLNAPSAPPPLAAKRRFTLLALVWTFVFAAAVSVKSSHVVQQTVFNRAGSIAVLPFQVISPVATDDLFGVGIADVIITRLSNVKEMSVRPTSAVRKYAGADQDAVVAGKRLRVDAVVQGTVRRVGDRIRVSVQLFTIDDGRAIWGRTFDENFTEAFKVEDAIAESVTTALTLKLTGEEHRRLAKRYTGNATAYRLYIAGRHRLTLRTSESYNKSIALFQAALQEDPDYAVAWAGLADAYAVGAIFKEASPEALWQKSASAAEKAVALDDDLSEAHSALGMAQMSQRHNRRAEHEFVRSLELNPSNVFARREYAMLLQSQRRFFEAIEQRQRALDLDPLSLSVNRELAWTYYLARRYDDSIRQQRLVLEMDPKYVPALLGLGQPLVAIGKVDEAIEGYRKALAIDENNIPTLVWLARALAVRGDRDEARSMLADVEKRARTRYVAPFHLAVVHAALGEPDKALALLEKAPDNGGANTLEVEPAFDSLRALPRYKALVHRLAAE